MRPFTVNKPRIATIAAASLYAQMAQPHASCGIVNGQTLCFRVADHMGSAPSLSIFISQFERGSPQSTITLDLSRLSTEILG
jgi:hypothetical protein